MDFKSTINKLVAQMGVLEDGVKANIQNALWAALPKMLKDNALKNSAACEALFGEGARWDSDTEIAVLSRVLAYPNIALPMCASITINHFHEPSHALVWLAVSTLWQRKSVVSTDTVYQYIAEHGHSIDLMYLEGLPQSAPANTEYTWGQFEGLLETLSNYALSREITRTCLESLEQVFRNNPENAQGIRADLTQKLNGIQAMGVSRVADAEGLSAGLLSTYAEKKARKQSGEKFFGVISGYYWLDKLTGGWQKGDLIIVGGRPSMGKTAFVLCCLMFAAMRGIPVLFFSLEMSREQLVIRLFAMAKSVPYERYRDGELSEEEEEQLNRFSATFARLPFFIDDSSGVSAAYIQDTTAKFVASSGVQLVAVDYLQQMSHSTDRRARPLDAVGDASKGLKIAAKSNNVPIIALSQLSRAVEQRMDKRPVMSDLRETGNIEQDADLIAFCYRPEYYKIMEDEQGRSTAGIAEIIVSKHRNGALDTIPLFFDARYAAFKELSEMPENYEAVMPQIIPDFDGGELEINLDEVKF